MSPQDTTPPNAPPLVPKSPETQFVQHGIDSEPGNTEQDYWIRVEWEWNTEADLAGYYAYRMDERDSLNGFPFVRIRDLRLGVDLRRTVDPIPFCIDQDPVLQPDLVTGFSHGFYYYVKAYDGSGNVSAASDTAYYRLLQKPRNLAINGSTSSVFSLVWEDYSQELFLLHYFFIRVYPEGNVTDRVWSYSASPYVTPFSVTFNLDSSANREFFRGGSDSLVAGTYGWMVDAVAEDPEHPAGAETRAVFTVVP